MYILSSFGCCHCCHCLVSSDQRVSCFRNFSAHFLLVHLCMLSCFKEAEVCALCYYLESTLLCNIVTGWNVHRNGSDPGDKLSEAQSFREVSAHGSFVTARFHWFYEQYFVDFLILPSEKVIWRLDDHGQNQNVTLGKALSHQQVLLLERQEMQDWTPECWSNLCGHLNQSTVKDQDKSGNQPYLWILPLTNVGGEQWLEMKQLS